MDTGKNKKNNAKRIEIKKEKNEVIRR